MLWAILKSKRLGLVGWLVVYENAVGSGIGEVRIVKTRVVLHTKWAPIYTVQSNPTTTRYFHMNNILIIELFLDEDLHINRLVRYKYPTRHWILLGLRCKILIKSHMKIFKHKTHSYTVKIDIETVRNINFS